MTYEFNTTDIFNLLRDTASRMKRMKKIPKNFDFIYIIEKKDIRPDWEELNKRLTEQCRTVLPKIQVDEKDLAQFAFYIDFVSLWFKVNGDPNKGDLSYVEWVHSFFVTYEEQLGPRDPETLYNKAFTR